MKFWSEPTFYDVRESDGTINMDRDGLLPDVPFQHRVMNADGAYEWANLRTADVFTHNNFAIVFVPGAFTPTCSSTHVPDLEAAHDDLVAAGCEAVYIVSVNDAFVMHQWKKHLGVEKCVFVADGNAEFTHALGLTVAKHNLGFGVRAWRSAICVVDGKVEGIFQEPNREHNCESDPFDGLTSAKNILSWFETRA